MAEAYHWKEWRIREDMVEALWNYVDNGVPLGDFLTAILAHDFYTAIGRADDDNLRNIQAYACWLYNEPPGGCHGSYEAVEEWIDLCKQMEEGK